MTGTILASLRERFAQALAAGEPETLAPLVSPDAEICTSTGGQGIGYEALRLLRCPAADCPIRKQSLENILCRQADGRARMSFHVLTLRARGTGPHFHFVQYGAVCVLTFEEHNGQTVITQIRYALQWADGNTAWLMPWCLPPDAPSVIRPEDSVAACISKLPLTSEEQAAEVLLQYAWAMDQDDDAFLRQTVTEDFAFRGALGSDDGYTLRICEIRVGENQAVLRARRLEPNSIGSGAIGWHNYYMDWFTADWEAELTLQNGSWRLRRITSKRRVAPQPAAESLT